MKHKAIDKALKPQQGYSYSDGNIVVGVDGKDVAINFNNTEGNQNTMITLDGNSAMVLAVLLREAVKAHGLGRVIQPRK